MCKFSTTCIFLFSLCLMGQTDQRICQIIQEVSADGIEKDVTTLVNFFQHHLR